MKQSARPDSRWNFNETPWHQQLFLTDEQTTEAQGTRIIGHSSLYREVTQIIDESSEFRAPEVAAPPLSTPPACVAIFSRQSAASFLPVMRCAPAFLFGRDHEESHNS
ncbi:MULTISPECIES: hypothetical protein [unclassified Shinella]|uniref:hypothetical protein n=1 Tax=unclassified Shinella TaxID=2643062 RepID=UPI00225CE449|nr:MULTISPECIES: hypothetical protein [unclassified Shinella]MCO5153641.1 hypothetical protein [Shinella sp.]MDC7259898.1 hypothetical protein [Shinella sp. YE25]CAI0341755.1 hypothetical protein SHINE37_80145 [Rhizobiaceae bacterium]CAK7262072.1 protein of unknown function [Shinella sp. WSC3-e]